MRPSASTFGLAPRRPFVAQQRQGAGRARIGSNFLFFLTLSSTLIVACALGCRAGADAATDVVRESLDASRSSWIQHIAYERTATSEVGRLTVRINGEDIIYLDVPTHVWEDFKNAESLGAFYGKHIKQRYERIQGIPLAERVETPPSAIATAIVECAFNEECESLLLRVLSMAQERVRVAAYAFTRARVAAALVEARARGADVRVKMDARQAEYPGSQRVIDLLRKNDIPVQLILVKGDYAAMHNKFVVVDGRYVAAGSYNFTTTAGSANWENLLLVDSPEIAAQYEAAWQTIVSE